MTRRQIITTLAVLLVVAVIGGFGIKEGLVKGSASVQNTSAHGSSANTTSAVTATNTSTASTGNYKDGTYSVESDYTSPGGAQAIKVSVTLKDGAVTDSTVTSEAKDIESKEHQSDFISAYKQYVTGKSISSIHLSRVAGASLTTNAFNNAITKIAAQANA